MIIVFKWILIVGFVAIVGLCLTSWRERLSKFFREVRIEMQKVAWPSRNDVIGSTVVVLVFVAILTVFVAGLDQILAWIMNIVLPGKGA